MTDVQQWVNWKAAQSFTADRIKQHKAKGITGYAVGADGFPFPPKLTAKRDAYGPFVQLAHEQGMTVCLGLQVGHYYNASTPFAPWFDGGETIGGGPKWEFDYTDPVNSEKRLSIKTMVHDFFAMVADLEVDEVWFDQEEYGSHPRHREWCDADRPGSDQFNGDNGRWSWRWDYRRDLAESANDPRFAHLDIPENVQSEQETHAQVRRRGEQLVEWILDAWPQARLAAYYNRFQGGEWERRWERNEQIKADRDPAYIKRPNPFWHQGVQRDLWAGILSNPGLGRFRHLGSGFYTTRGADMMERARRNLRSTYLSLVPDPARLHDILYIEPFIWLDPSRSTTEHPYPGDEKNVEHAANAGAKAEHVVSVYAHQFDTAAEYTDTGIWAAIAAAAACTPAAVDPYEPSDPAQPPLIKPDPPLEPKPEPEPQPEPEPEPPASTREAELQARIDELEAHVAELGAEVEERTLALAQLSAAWRTLSGLEGRKAST